MAGLASEPLCCDQATDRASRVEWMQRRMASVTIEDQRQWVATIAAHVVGAGKKWIMQRVVRRRHATVPIR